MLDDNIINKITEEKTLLLENFLNNIPFEGVNIKNLEYSCISCGLQKDKYLLYFPHINDVIEEFHKYIDNKMSNELSKLDIANMKVRERIKVCLDTRFKLMEPYKVAVNAFIAHNLISFNCKNSLEHLWHTADLIWNISLDNSTDYNYYTKRFILSSLYTKTLLFWLSDDSENCLETSNLLDAEIEKILKIGKFNLEESLLKIKNKIPFIRLINFTK